MRETPTVARHLHVPLQSGDDGVLKAMKRRYTAATYLRRVALADGFNLTTDAIVGFPAEDDGGVRGDAAPRRDRRDHQDPRLPVLAAAGYGHGRKRHGSSAVKRERGARLRAASDAACRRRWAERLGSEDTVLVDRPGIGYGDDYTPWLVDAAVGDLVRVRAERVVEEGIVGVAA